MCLMTEDETTFLCGLQLTRRYGSTGTPQFATQKFITIVQHQVVSTDTLQGLALKYNSSMTEIRRMNKLWSNESIHLKDELQIPVLDDSQKTNGECSVKYDKSRSSVERSRFPDKVTESAIDMFARIDRTIRKTAKNVRKIERESTLDKALESDGESDMSQDSIRMLKLRSSQHQTKSRRLRHSQPHWQHSHDQFYQL